MATADGRRLDRSAQLAREDRHLLDAAPTPGVAVAAYLTLAGRLLRESRWTEGCPVGTVALEAPSLPDAVADACAPRPAPERAVAQVRALSRLALSTAMRSFASVGPDEAPSSSSIVSVRSA